MFISKRAAAVTGSVTLAIDGMAKRMKAEGQSVIGFGAGEPDFDTPGHIVEAAKRAMEQGKTRYTPAGGILELRQAVCGIYAKRGLEYGPENVVVGNGAKQAVHNCLQCMLDEGDEVIIPAPCWVSYPELVAMSGGKPVFVPTSGQNGFLPDPDDIERAVTPRSKCILINSPNNPCGNIYPEEILRAIANTALRHGLVVISDEIYENLVYSGKKAVSIAALGEDIRRSTVIINGVSKTYAMTGWRIGYAVCPGELGPAMTRWQSHATGNPSSIAQYAALAAITGPQQCVEDMRTQFEQRRDYMVKRVQAMEGVSCTRPDGAFYVMLDISAQKGRSCEGREIKGSEDFAELLLATGGVAAVPCAAFGTDNYIRLSYAVSMEDIEQGMDRIGAFINRLK